MVAPIIEGSARRWFYKHMTISFGLGIIGAECWSRFYEIPRKAHRDAYYRSQGVEWTRIID
jgi:hypothetical protein